MISFGWYLADEVYGNSNTEASAAPELTTERIDVLRRIAGMSNENEFSTVTTALETDSTDDLITLDGMSVKPSESGKVNNLSATPEWESFLGVDHNGSKEGFAFSGWTTLSSNHIWPVEKIQAALVASCSDAGERSVYIRMLSFYPGSENDSVNMVQGQVGWDSSNPYSAPFTYDVGLNALRLRAGIDDSFSLIENGNKVTIQIPWDDSNRAVFEFSLNGSSRALKTALDYCSSTLTG